MSCVHAHVTCRVDLEDTRIDDVVARLILCGAMPHAFWLHQGTRNLILWYGVNTVSIAAFF
jgi:hypothetical protein